MITAATLYGLAAALADDVLDALAAQPEAIAPCRVLVSPYLAVADDGCCESPDGTCAGQLAVTVDQVGRSREFPLQTSLGVPMACDCGGDEFVVLRARLSRCVPVLDDQGNAPSPEVLSGVAAVALADAAALSNASCSFGDRVPQGRTVPGPVLPFGPEGGCGAYEVTITVDPDGFTIEE